jgi:hypothetical protein
LQLVQDWRVFNRAGVVDSQQLHPVFPRELFKRDLPVLGVQAGQYISQCGEHRLRTVRSGIVFKLVNLLLRLQRGNLLLLSRRHCDFELQNL